MLIYQFLYKEQMLDIMQNNLLKLLVGLLVGLFDTVGDSEGALVGDIVHVPHST